MRINGSISSISWIPSEAVRGVARLPFGTGVAHYDQAPPDVIGVDGAMLHELCSRDRFRFANHLGAYIEVDSAGRIVDAGYTGGGLIGVTKLAVGREISVAAVALPDRQAAPEIGTDRVRFVQTAGGRTGVPAPRTVNRPPFVQIQAPIAWSTLALTMYADGRIEGELIGASSFPRHWVYDTHGALTAKSGLIDFTRWYRDAFDAHTPWGDLDSPALVTAVETALERELSTVLMRGGRRPKIVRARAGERLVSQGDPARDLFVLLDGVVAVDVDGAELCLVGPGAVMGERGLLEGGHRTATVTARTACKIAVASAGDIDDALLRQLAATHRREDTLLPDTATPPAGA